MHNALHIFVFSLGLTLLAPGCNKDEAKSEGSAAATEAGKEATAAKGKKAKKAKKDPGELGMKLDGVDWTAERTRATLKDGRLTIKASITDIDEGKVSRQELHLKLKDYKGPGEYTTEMHGSLLLGIGVDTKAAAGGDKEATEEATKAIKGAKTILLGGATVKIETASDSEIAGSFSYDIKGGRASLTEGSFRAPLKIK